MRKIRKNSREIVEVPAAFEGYVELFSHLRRRGLLQDGGSACEIYDQLGELNEQLYKLESETHALLYDYVMKHKTEFGCA